MAVFFYVARKEKILRKRGTACLPPAVGFRFGVFRPVMFALFTVVVLALSLSYGGRHTCVPRPPYNLYDGRRMVVRQPPHPHLYAINGAECCRRRHAMTACGHRQGVADGGRRSHNEETAGGRLARSIFFSYLCPCV